MAQSYAPNAEGEIKELQPLYIKNRRYLGAKTRMLDKIWDVVESNCTDVETVADVFAGTGVVADMFHRHDKKVIVNDLLYSNYVSYDCWFGTDEVDRDRIEKCLIDLNNIKGISDYVEKNFGNKYFSMENARRIDAIRTQIEEWRQEDHINQREYHILLTSLLYAMDKSANTVGHYDAYRKKMDIMDRLILKMPVLTDNDGNQIYNMDANLLVKKIEADLVYIDPPYNSRGYENAYHVLENIMEWKKPKVEGVAVKAVDRHSKTSRYTRKSSPDAFKELLDGINARYILVSYNNMGNKGNARSNAKISDDQLRKMLSDKGELLVFEIDFQAFTTGKSKINDHKELLYLCKLTTSKR